MEALGGVDRSCKSRGDLRFAHSIGKFVGIRAEYINTGTRARPCSKHDERLQLRAAQHTLK
jgi:hypothetical protein